MKNKIIIGLGIGVVIALLYNNFVAKKSASKTGGGVGGGSSDETTDTPIMEHRPMPEGQKEEAPYSKPIPEYGGTIGSDNILPAEPDEDTSTGGFTAVSSGEATLLSFDGIGNQYDIDVRNMDI